MAWFNALLGKLKYQGAEKELRGSLNFKGPGVIMTPTAEGYDLEFPATGGDGSGSTAALKDAVATIATANITLSGIGQVISGHTVANGDAIGALEQTSGIASGIYVAASGAWTRRADWAAGAVIDGGCQFTVAGGTFKGYSCQLDTTGTITVGTHSPTFLVRELLDSTGHDAELVIATAGVSGYGKASNAHIATNAGIELAKLEQASAKNQVPRRAATGAGAVTYGDAPPGRALTVDYVQLTNVTQSGAAALAEGSVTAGVTRVLCPAQTDPAQNGLWVIQTGAWTRPTDYNDDADVRVSTRVHVTGGLYYANSEWKLTSGSTIAGSKTFARTDLTDVEFDLTKHPYNVPYWGVPGTAPDSAAAILRVLADAKTVVDANSTTKITIRFPKSGYVRSSVPILAACKNVRLEGGCTLETAFSGGPHGGAQSIEDWATTAAPSTVAAGGEDRWLVADPTVVGNKFLNLTHAGLWVDSWSVFTVKGYLGNIATQTGSSWHVISCAGRREHNATRQYCFGLYVDPDGTVGALARLGGVDYNLASAPGVINVGSATNYYFELTSDGSTLRLWVGALGASLSAPVASTAVSGALAQYSYEECILGGDTHDAIGRYASIANGVKGNIGGWVVENVAGHTSAFTAPNVILTYAGGATKGIRFNPASTLLSANHQYYQLITPGGQPCYALLSFLDYAGSACHAFEIGGSLKLRDASGRCTAVSLFNSLYSDVTLCEIDGHRDGYRNTGISYGCQVQIGRTRTTRCPMFGSSGFTWRGTGFHAGMQGPSGNVGGTNFGGFGAVLNGNMVCLDGQLFQPDHPPDCGLIVAQAALTLQGWSWSAEAYDDGAHPSYATVLFVGTGGGVTFPCNVTKSYFQCRNQSPMFVTSGNPNNQIVISECEVYDYGTGGVYTPYLVRVDTPATQAPVVERNVKFPTTMALTNTAGKVIKSLGDRRVNQLSSPAATIAAAFLDTFSTVPDAGEYQVSVIVEVTQGVGTSVQVDLDWTNATGARNWNSGALSLAAAGSFEFSFRAVFDGSATAGHPPKWKTTVIAGGTAIYRVRIYATQLLRD